jgi:putative oxidoreductase
MTTIISGHISNARLLHFAVWTAQLALASFFGVMAMLKLILHFERVVELIAWAGSVPEPFVRTLGVVELLGAIVVAAPAVTPAPQRVVGWTAVGFLTLMFSAAIIHIARGEPRMLAINLLVGALAAFVAWGRLMHLPLEVEEAS